MKQFDLHFKTIIDNHESIVQVFYFACWKSLVMEGWCYVVQYRYLINHRDLIR